MKKLSFLFFLTFLFATTTTYGQTTNYALQFPNGGKADLGLFSDLTGTKALTLQFWMHPTSWSGPQTILHDGDNLLSVGLGEEVSQELYFKLSSASIVAKNTGLAVNKWSHITVVYSGHDVPSVQIWIDGKRSETVVNGQIPDLFPALTTALVLGGSYVGRLDELRMWNTVLKPADFMIKNTVNQYHPQYHALLAYYKFDQQECEDLYDYCQKHHGVLSDVSKVVVADNFNFKYRLVSGYTNYTRFFDRANIDEQMYRLTNDLIILNLKAYPDGTAYMEGADNTGTLVNAKHLTSYSNRGGVLSFEGKGSYMNIGSHTLFYKPVEAINMATFESWIYIEEWNTGAALFSKKEREDACFVISLGDESKKELVVNLNGQIYTVANKLKVGQWQHLAVRTNSTGGSNRLKFNYCFDGLYSTSTTYPTEGTVSTQMPLLPNTHTYVGLDFKGKMDEIMLFVTQRSDDQVKKEMKEGLPLPKIGVNIGANSLFDINAYFKADDAQNPTLDHYSWKSHVEAMRVAYKGCRGMKIRAGLIAEGDWKVMIADTQKRAKLIATITPYMEFLDGLDIDFEWCYTDQTCWNNYAKLMEEIRAIIPVESGKKLSISPHSVSFKLTQSALSIPDFCTFQQYGPRPASAYYNNFTNSCQEFKSWGYQNNQILASIPTIVSELNGAVPPTGYFTVMMANPGLKPSDNRVVYNDRTWDFNGVDLVKKKTEYIIEQDFGGVMYFDMGNDLPTTDERSIVRAISQVINANVDTLVTTITPTGVSELEVNGYDCLKIYPNPAQSHVVVESALHNLTGGVAPQLSICDISGKKVHQERIYDAVQSINISDIRDGAYLIFITSEKGVSRSKLIVKR